jgi:hypothetical protein
MENINRRQGIEAAAIFVDNDAEKVKQVKEYCGNVVAVQIPESHCINKTQTIVTTLLAEQPRAIDTENNLYFKLHTVNRAPHIFYDVKSGIRKEHITALKHWIIDTTHAPKRYAFFDWDRTLTMCEGVILPERAHALPNIADAYKQFNVPNGTETQIYEDMSIYLAGGAKRLAMLRSMFDLLNDKGINIVLLTNNGACVSATQKLYFEKLARKFIGYDDIDFICSSTTSDPYSLKHTQRGNKGYALRKLPAYAAACKGKTAGGCGACIGATTRQRNKRRVN